MELSLFFQQTVNSMRTVISQGLQKCLGINILMREGWVPSYCSVNGGEEGRHQWGSQEVG